LASVYILTEKKSHNLPFFGWEKTVLFKSNYTHGVSTNIRIILLFHQRRQSWFLSCKLPANKHRCTLWNYGDV